MSALIPLRLIYLRCSERRFVPCMDGARGARGESDVSANRSGAAMYSAFECSRSGCDPLIGPKQKHALFARVAHSRVFRSTVSTVSHQRLYHPLQFMKRTDATSSSHRLSSSHAAADLELRPHVFRHQANRANNSPRQIETVVCGGFDLIELNGDDLRRDPLEVRKATLASVLAKAGAGETLSTRSGNRWSVLAELYRAYEGQPVERRFVSLRIDTPAQPLGHGGDGRVHTPDHRLWR